MRVFLDANILFSAAYTEQSAAGRIFFLQQLGFCELLTSAYALDEARRNIAAKRPARSFAVESFAPSLTITPEPSAAAIAAAAENGLPAKDAPILAATIAGKSDVLTTGDRAHFGHLYGQTIAGVRMLTLSDTLALLVG